MGPSVGLSLEGGAPPGSRVMEGVPGAFLLHIDYCCALGYSVFLFQRGARVVILYISPREFGSSQDIHKCPRFYDFMIWDNYGYASLFNPSQLNMASFLRNKRKTPLLKDFDEFLC